jgi:hypothetical protein
MQATFWIYRVMVLHCSRVRAARIYRSRHLGESSLARIGKVRKIFLDAGGDPTTSRLDMGAGLFDICRASPG